MQSVGTLDEQTCCTGAVVSVGGDGLADPSSEMSVVATTPRSAPKARAVVAMNTRGFTAAPYEAGGVAGIGSRCPIGGFRYLSWSVPKVGSVARAFVPRSTDAPRRRPRPAARRPSMSPVQINLKTHAAASADSTSHVMSEMSYVSFRRGGHVSRCQNQPARGAGVDGDDGNERECRPAVESRTRRADSWMILTPVAGRRHH